MDDQKIIKLRWQMAESAIEALAKKFGNRPMSIAMNILGGYQDAEESVNDTYLAVWNTVPPKKPDPLAGYVYATGRNISLDRLKYNTADVQSFIPPIHIFLKEIFFPFADPSGDF